MSSSAKRKPSSSASGSPGSHLESAAGTGEARDPVRAVREEERSDPAGRAIRPSGTPLVREGTGDSSEREALPLLAEMSGRPSSRPPGASLMPGCGSGSRAPVRTSEPSCFGASIPFDSPGDSGSSAFSPGLLSARHWCPAPTPEWRVGRTSRGRSYSAPSDFAPAVRVSRASARVAHDE